MTHHDDPPGTPGEHWEARYTRSDRIWSGNPNATTARVITDVLGPADFVEDSSGARRTALDLGCGEGADVVWLAEQGWFALGVDISPTAVRRARETAAQRRITSTSGGATEFRVLDLARDPLPEGPFDLVVASFLQSHAALPRAVILRGGAERVAPGGHLLLVTHAAPPPWSEHAHDELTGPAEDWAELALPEAQWDLEICEIVHREAVSPEGQAAVLEDGIVLARRR